MVQTNKLTTKSLFCTVRKVNLIGCMADLKIPALSMKKDKDKKIKTLEQILYMVRMDFREYWLWILLKNRNTLPLCEKIKCLLFWCSFMLYSTRYLFMSKFGQVTVTTKIGQLSYMPDFRSDQLNCDRSRDRTISTLAQWLYTNAPLCSQFHKL